MTSDRASELLADVSRLRARTRRSVASPAPAAIAFGATTVLAAIVLALFGSRAFAVTWIVAGTATLLGVGRAYRRQGHRRGATGRGRRAMIWSWGLFVLCFVIALAAASIGSRVSGVVAPIVFVILGYAGLGAFSRRIGPAAAVAAAGLVAIALALAGATPWLVELVFGAGLIASGLGSVLGERSR